ncbi:MAG: hypothetical protein ACLP70_24885, partial [Streptosporangiaceae bacterium]
MSSREGSFAGLGGQAGQDAIQPAGQGPVGRADQVHEGRHQQAADEQGVDEHREGVLGLFGRIVPA